LKFIGRAKTKWVDSNGDDSHTIEGSEVYLDEKIVMVGRNEELTAGIHRFNFRVQLPPNLPASLEFNFGKIQYSIEAVIDLPWKFNQQTKVFFNVLRKDDYSGKPMLASPQGAEHEIQTADIFSWTSKPLLASVSIPYSVFTPGSAIPITIHLENRSNKNIIRIHMKLKQYVKFIW
jgi:hypothetical protein